MPILIAAAVLGIVAGIAALMIVLLGQDWEDLLWLLSAVMIGSAAARRRCATSSAAALR